MTLYAALEDRLLVVGETTGTAEERMPGERLESVAASPAAPERVFVGTVETGLRRSVDGGHTWETALATDDRVTAVTVSPHDPDVVWAGTEPSAVYRSTDGGATWTERPRLTDLDSADRWSFPPRPHTHHVRWIAVHPEEPGRLYVAIEAGALVRTPDGGATWIDHPTGARRDNHTLATHPAAPDRVYAAAGDGYAESGDAGDSWTYPQDGLDHRYVWGLAVDPRDPDRVVVSAATGARDAHDTGGASYVYRTVTADGDGSDDGSANGADPDGDGTGAGSEGGHGGWALAMEGLPGPEGLARTVLAADDEGFYALTNHGLFRSPEGAVWELMPLSWPAGDRLPRGLAVV